MNLPVSRVESDVAVQHSAGLIVTELQDSLGSRYGGLWFDDTSSTFHVMTPSAADEAAVRAAVAELGLSDSTHIEVVAHSEDALREAATSLEARLGTLVHSRRAEVGLDLPTDSLTVSLASTVAAAEADQVRSADEGLPGDPTVSIKSVAPAVLEEVAAVACKFPNCNLPVRGGVRTFDVEGTATCMTGFDVKDANEYTYILTAGHCVVEEYPESWAIANAENTIGYTLGKPIAGLLGEGKDAGVVESTKYVPIPDIAVWAMNEAGEVTGISEAEYYIKNEVAKAYEGEIECHIGKHTGTECGEVTSVNKHTTVEYAEPWGVKVIEHTDKICALALGGDSGGPVAANHYATAITIAGNSKNAALKAADRPSMRCNTLTKT